MNPEHPTEFDDPGLKEAVRKVWPKTTASPLARQRITELLQRSTAEAVEATAARPPRRIRWLAYAAAAVIVLALTGFIGYRVYEASEYREYVDTNMDRFRRMLAIHAARSNSPGELDAPDPDALARQLGRPVASLPSSHAMPLAATIVQFDDQSRVAHVHYGPPHHLSVLSLPASALVEAHDGFRYDIDIDAYHLIGEVRGGNVFCVIADPRADVDFLREMVSHITVANPPSLP